MKYKYLIFCAFILLGSLLIAKVAIPEPEGFVNDFAGLLSEDARIRINDWAIELREKTDVDFMIATFKENGGEDDLLFGDRIYQSWKIGSGKDEGVLIWLALKERRLGIETGYGAEPYITDAFASQVREEMKRYLAKGSEDWDMAFTQGALRLLEKIALEKGVKLEGVSEYAKGRPSEATSGKVVVIVFLLVVFLLMTRGNLLRWLFWRGTWGGGGPRGPWGGGGSWGGGNSSGSGGKGSGGGFGGFGGFGGTGGGSSGGGGSRGGF